MAVPKVRRCSRGLDVLVQERHHDFNEQFVLRRREPGCDPYQTTAHWRIDPMLLERFLSSYDFRQFHQRDVAAPASRVFRAIKECTPGELPIMRVLMAVRLLASLLTGERRLGGVGKG